MKKFEYDDVKEYFEENLEYFGCSKCKYNYIKECIDF